MGIVSSIVEEFCFNEGRYRIAVVFTWLYALVIALPPLSGFSSYTYEPFATSCTINWFSEDSADVLYCLLGIFMTFCVHLPIIVACYGAIICRERRVAKAARKHINTTPNGDAPALANGQPKLQETDLDNPKLNIDTVPQRRDMSVVLTLAYVFAWLPYSWMYLMVLTGRLKEPLDSHEMIMSSMPVLCAKSSTMVTPLLYAIFNIQVRRVIVDTFKRPTN
ncbi:hypothetical protein Ciccas_011396 [Cichlidogyrus casuarinus]|uniref:G-protein coupled receptors family 1 profile domain-containing protein n=1 Tax=Cichlidogyrus casuarinus TaxID=1844966 RepID=A0ABD2PS69_9PLAT